MKRIPLPNYIRRSGDEFETVERFVDNSFLIDTTSHTLTCAGIPMTKLDDKVVAASKEELHCFVIGDSGSGKTRRVILPTIVMAAKAGESMVISDPKGELYRFTAQTLRSSGYNVQVLNFRNPSRGSRWNPLTYIEKLYRSGNRDKKDHAMNSLKDLIDVMKKGISSEKDRYWENVASDFFLGVAQLILEYGDVGSLTFENVSNVAHSMVEDAEKGNTNNKKLLSMLPDKSPIPHNITGVITAPNNTRSSLISVFNGMIAPYVNQAALIDLFSCSEIDVEQIGERPTAIFFILPDDSTALYPIATVLVKQVYSTLVDLADSSSSGCLKNRVTFLLDEFANFAPIPAIDSMLTAARSRGIRFVLVCQSMEQLNAKYTSNGAEILMANCRVWLYMSCRNLPFLERLSYMSGQYISPQTGERHPLLSVADLQHFSMGQVLLLNDRCRPYIGFLPDFSEYDFGDSHIEKCDIQENPHAGRRVSVSYEDINQKISDHLFSNRLIVPAHPDLSSLVVSVDDTLPTASSQTAEPKPHSAASRPQTQSVSDFAEQIKRKIQNKRNSGSSSGT